MIWFCIAGTALCLAIGWELKGIRSQAKQDKREERLNEVAEEFHLKRKRK